MAKKKQEPFDQGKGVRKIARERIGAVPPAREIEDKSKRKKPKHKKPVTAEETGSL